MEKNSKMESIISLCKRRGFIFQSSEIYGGLAGFWDYGPLGVTLKNNIKNSWWKNFVEDREDMLGLDSATILSSKVWEASGHLGAGFTDPLSECEKCHKRFRTDKLEDRIKCSECGGKLGEERKFNMMFGVNVGALEKNIEPSAYLRGETAQGIFINFKNIIDSFHPKLPFGVAQIGKAYRNEISPRDFIFRAREFEQMEIEYFVKAEDWRAHFENWKKEMLMWFLQIGLRHDSIHELEVGEKDRAHYSRRTVDFEFDFPFGRDEICGLVYRGDFDLSNHSEKSAASLSYFDETTKERFLPHVVEPSFGLDRLILAVLLSAYEEDELGGEKRIFLKLSSKIAPVKVAVFPLLKNKPDLVEKAREVYKILKKNFGGGMIFDDNGNIGKRYRRQDEIGTPWCVTIDFGTLENNTVTLRDRDSGEQRRLAVRELSTMFLSEISGN